MSFNTVVEQAEHEWKEFFQREERKKERFPKWLRRAMEIARHTTVSSQNYNGFYAAFTDPEICGYEHIQLLSTGYTPEEVRGKSTKDIEKTQIISCGDDLGFGLPWVFAEALQDIKTSESIDDMLSSQGNLNQFGPMCNLSNYERTQHWYGDVGRRALEKGIGESDGTILVMEHPLRNDYTVNILDTVGFSGNARDLDPRDVFNKYQPKPQSELPDVFYLIMEGREVKYVLNVPLIKEKEVI